MTDKTGTLTKNDMIFKKLNMEYTSFDVETDKDLKKLLLENSTQKKESGPMSDVFEKN